MKAIPFPRTFRDKSENWQCLNSLEIMEWNNNHNNNQEYYENYDEEQNGWENENDNSQTEKTGKNKKRKERKKKKKQARLSTDLQKINLDPKNIPFGADNFKYWIQRYRYFSKYDEGIMMDQGTLCLQ